VVDALIERLRLDRAKPRKVERYNHEVETGQLPPSPRIREALERCDPVRIVVFGSLARDEEGPDSDIDLLVVLPRVGNTREAAVEVRPAVDEPVPVDILVTDPEEIARRGHVIGTTLEAALHDSRVV